jgi:hypothetical protein
MTNNKQETYQDLEPGYDKEPEYYVIDFSKLKTLKDVKNLLECMEIRFGKEYMHFDKLKKLELIKPC